MSEGGVAEGQEVARAALVQPKNRRGWYRLEATANWPPGRLGGTASYATETINWAENGRGERR